MTVVVGIYCEDGIVIAGDSALTINQVIEQTYPKKLACLEPNLIIGFAGDLGFAQRYRQVVTNFWNNSTIQNLETYETYQVINEFCRNGINEFLHTHKSDAPVNIPTLFLIGFVHKGKHNLVVYPGGDFQPMVLNHNLPFFSIGSGHFITNTFLGFAKQVFWQGNIVPSLSRGIFSAVMALNLAIDINAGGINKPLHVAVIQKCHDVYICKKLSDGEISYHQENCNEALKYFSSYEHIFDNVNGAADIPQISQS